MAIINHGSSAMDNRNVPILCSQEKSNSKTKDEKVKARTNVMNAIQDAKKLEFEGDIGKSGEFTNSGRINVWGNENTCSLLFGDDAEILNSKDSQVIRVKDDEDKFEVSLDTSQYRPDEVKVNIGNGMICVDGKHEEKSGHERTMVSRQFSRKYSLPAGAKPKNVVSNLSSDGVLVITLDKKSLKSQSISLEKELNGNDENISKNERVATNLRSNFLTDPFFKTNWDNLDNVHHKIRNIFYDVSKKEEETNNKSISSNQTVEQNENFESFSEDKNENEQHQDLLLNKRMVNCYPKPWMLPALSNNLTSYKFGSMNGEFISQTEDEGILEWKMDISGYEPEEVNVSVSQENIIVEGSHEDRSKEGKQIFSKSFIKKYSIPNEVSQSDVQSKFTSDHALIVSIQKTMTNQHLQMKNEKGKKPSDTAAHDIWNSFEHNYNTASEDDYLNLDYGAKIKEKSKSTKGPHNVNIEQIENNMSNNLINEIQTSNNNYKTDERKGHRNVRIVQGMPTQIISESYNHKPNINVDGHIDVHDNMDGKEGGPQGKQVATSLDIDKNLKVEITDITDEEGDSKQMGFNRANMNDQSVKTSSDADTKVKSSAGSTEIKTHQIIPKKTSAASENPVYRKVKITKKINEEGKESPKSECLSNGIQYRSVPIRTNHKLEENTICDTKKEPYSKEIEYNHGHIERRIEINEDINRHTTNLKKSEDKEKVIHVPIKQSLYSQKKLNSESNHSTQKLKEEDICLSNVAMDRVKSPELTNVKVIHQSTLPESIIVPKKNVTVEQARENFSDSSLFSRRPQDYYPEKYRLPSNLTKKLDLFQTKDEQVIRLVDNQDKFEVSLDTSQYRPDQLRIWMKERIIFVEAKHEEKSEDGRKMTSRQFSRKYNLPPGAKPENVTTNLSSDGVLVITAKKQNLQIQQEESMNITKENSRFQQEATMNKTNENSRVPITMRHLFFDDPFFKSTWGDIDNIKESMFNESTELWKGWKENSLLNEKSMFSNHQSFIDEMMQSYEDEEKGWMMPRKWMIPSMFSSDFAKQLDLFQTKDSEVIQVKDNDDKFEVSLDTSKYRPDELSVNVEDGVISVEGKHEEKCEDGRNLASRQFTRKYSLPSGADLQSIVSKISSDGLLVISATKEKCFTERQRRVPILSVN